ncbi:hypothetical protein HZC07_03285, partial [Candidatus Micrarchaeota archaeon]|nr:hypothetical protein [Candidatus Micrarchaeota archaeon]
MVASEHDSEHEVFHSSLLSTSLNFSNGELKVKESSSSSGFGVRVVKNKKIGFSYCQNDSDLNKTIQAADSLSKFAVTSSFSFSEKVKFRNLDSIIFDKKLEDCTTKHLASILGTIREGAESHGGKCRIMLDSGSGKISIDNTSGFSGTYDHTALSAYVETMHFDGFGFNYFSSNKLPADSAFFEIGNYAASMAKNMIGAKKPHTGQKIP